jgi:Zn-dependent protease with chaperone function
MLPRVPALLLAFASLVACAPTRLPEAGSATGGADEQRLIRVAADIDHGLLAAGVEFADDALDRYLAAVVARVAADAGVTKVRVVRFASVNAFALPNGSVWIHAGLLAQLADEDQLAFVVAHEAAHLRRHHAFAASSDRSRTKLLTQLGGLVLAPIGLADPIANGLYAQVVAGYGREREAEADRDAFAAVVAAGYSPQTLPAFFDRLDAVAAPGDQTAYSDHPSDAARKAAVIDLIARRGAVPSETLGTGSDTYWAATRTVATESIRLCIGTGDLQRALAEAEARLARDATDARVHLLRGDALRRMADRTGDADGFAAAVAAYDRALAIDPSVAEAHRGLGYIALHRGEKETARREFEQYLHAGTHVADRRFVQAILAKDLAP